MLQLVNDKTYQAVDFAANIVALNMRESDYFEAYNYCGSNPVRAVMDSWHRSCRKYLLVDDYVPIALIGIESIGDGVGMPWMVGTDRLSESKVRKFVARNSKRVISELSAGHSVLMNYVGANNENSINWLKFCGFKISDEIEHGPIGGQFRSFSMRTH